MEFKDYCKYAERTLSTNFNADNAKTQTDLVDTVEAILEIGNKLDQIKKIIFYNKENTLPGNSENKEFTKPDLKNQKLLHGAIGMVTESLELLEEVFFSIQNGKAVDVPHVSEELNDSNWYQSIFVRELELDFHKGLETNIKKLAARYGDKFDDFKALNRDLSTERDILEGK